MVVSDFILNLSRAHGQAHGQAPQAGLRFAHAIDGLVGPFGGRGRQRLGVGVIGRGVDGQEPEALAVA